ncbi:hypothetical protein AAC387_Pa09g0013 [Persea americana]
MKKGSKLWLMVPCTSSKSLRTDSRKGIEEILKSGLATIQEEPEMFLENELEAEEGEGRRRKRTEKVNKGRRVKGHAMNLGDIYVHFMVGFSSKRGLGGLTRC